MPDLSILIVNWNTCELLRQCLASVYDHTQSILYEVFVVDNASSDDSVPMVEREFPMVQLLKNRANLGFAKANNQALARACGRYVLLLNSDTKITENAFFQMIRFMETHPAVGIAGPQLLNPDGSRQYSCDYFPRQPASLFRDKILDICWPQNHITRRGKMRQWEYDSNFRVDYVIGAALMIRRETFQTIGPLDAQFFMYAEDIDWCYRAMQTGWHTMYLGNIHVIHYNRGSSQRTDEQCQHLSDLRQDSLVRFYTKHYGKLSAWLLTCILRLKRTGSQEQYCREHPDFDEKF